MAIQPIDLQTMYSQMATIAQSVQHTQEGLPLAQAMQQQNIVQHNLEEATRVLPPSNEGTESHSIKNENGGSSAKGESQTQGKKRNNDLQKESIHSETVRESFIGQHVDITR